MPFRIARLHLLCWLMLSGGAFTQNPTSHTAIANQSITVTNTEIQQAINDAPKSGTKDTVLRVASIGGEYNVGVSVVRRSRVNGKTVPDALQHHAITEVYEVLAGCGTLATGGILEGAKELPPDDPDVARQIGPSAEGVMVKDGKTERIRPGDIVIIPADTPHGFAEICPEGISYVLVRIDPHRVLQLR
jgi:hypothetical protein